MNRTMSQLWMAIPIGVGGSAFMDLWGTMVRRVLKAPTLDYALLGRWLGHIPHGQVRHDRIGDAPRIPGERPIGWVAHYAIGIAFALALLVVAGPDWPHAPTVAPALAVGVATILAPWLVMQPAMGSGFAGSGTPSPTATRIRNLATHVVFGLGAYATAAAISWLR